MCGRQSTPVSKGYTMNASDYLAKKQQPSAGSPARNLDGVSSNAQPMIDRAYADLKYFADPFNFDPTEPKLVQEFISECIDMSAGKIVNPAAKPVDHWHQLIQQNELAGTLEVAAHILTTKSDYHRQAWQQSSELFPKAYRPPSKPGRNGWQAQVGLILWLEDAGVVTVDGYTPYALEAGGEITPEITAAYYLQQALKNRQPDIAEMPPSANDILAGALPCMNFGKVHSPQEDREAIDDEALIGELESEIGAGHYDKSEAIKALNSLAAAGKITKPRYEDARGRIGQAYNRCKTLTKAGRVTEAEAALAALMI